MLVGVEHEQTGWSNMPYIKREDRPFYDAIAYSILSRLHCSHIKLDLSAELKSLSMRLKSVDLKAVDGHFNYFLTKLLKKSGCLGQIIFIEEWREPLGTFLIKLLKEIYPPKYFNYNRGVGMLTCCVKEFRRRFGDNALAVEDFLEYVIECFYLDIVGPYEDKKIAENGDLE